MLSLDQWIKLNGQTAGKDKLTRLLQYICRFLWYYVEHQKDSIRFRDTGQKLRILESSLSSFRKVLRLGKSLDVLYGALKSLSLSDPVVRVCVTLSRIYQAFFLICDHLVWMARTGLVKLDGSSAARYANRFWLYSIIVNLIRDIHEIHQVWLLHYKQNLRKISLSKSMWPQFSFISIMMNKRPDVVWDTIKNSCDLLIPISSLGKINITPGMVGLLGTISSIAGLVALIDPVNKLTP